MKTSSFPLYIFTATLFALPVLAQTEPATEKARHERSGEMGPRMQETIKRYDKDGDGKLNDAERAEAGKAREEMRKKRNGAGGQ